jgi:hypothetical protein
VKSVEPRRLPRNDETPICTFIPHGAPEDQAQIRFGEWLLRRALITRAELFRALEQAKAHRCRVGDALVALGAMGRSQVEEEATAFATFAGFQGGSPLGLPREC